MTDAEVQELIMKIAATTLHYYECAMVGSDWSECDCTAYEDVESVIEALLT
jgi:hypothetical protein